MPMEVDTGGTPPSWASDASKRLASLALHASNVSTSKTHMAHLLLSPFASHLYELAALLKELQREIEIRGALLPLPLIQRFDAVLANAEQFVDDYSNRCPLYLLMCCPDLLVQLKKTYGSLTAVVQSFAQHQGWSGSLKLRLDDEKQALDQISCIKLGAKEQSLHDSLEQGLLDSIVTDASLVAKLAKQIAECLGFSSVDSEGFMTELSRLKREKGRAEVWRGKAHALYLDQFIVLLDKAVAASKMESTNKEAVAMAVPPSPRVRDTLVLPLRSFVCPITQDVMRDPVQIASGQTYERKAIERWFEEGHTRCPTGVELANLNMKSNIALKQSIAEWKERNNNIRLDVANDLVRSWVKEQQMKALQDLQALCEEDSLYKYKVGSKNLMPVLVHLAESSDLELRKKAVCVLTRLADNEECQELMVKEKVIELVVRCLARQNDEASLCVQLLLKLSGNPDVADRISRVPSAVLFLVTLIQDEHCSDSVKGILQNLPKSDENVVIMAEANIIKPLIMRLNEGEGASRVLLAKTLGRLHIPDSSKMVAATPETLQTLVKMAETGREEEREAALAGLENLSTVSSARQGLFAIYDRGFLPKLLNFLKGVRYSDAAKRSSATILANIVAAEDLNTTDAELEEIVYSYFQLLGPPTPATVQLPLLQGLLGLASNTSIGSRQKMKESDAFTCLIRHFLSIDDASLRRPCLDLLACLAADFCQDAAEAVAAFPDIVPCLVEILKDPKREAELQGVTALLASLPSTDKRVTNLLLRNPELLHCLIKVFKNHRNEATVEAAAGALLRFTLPSDLDLQLSLASEDVIELYVALLRSGGSLAKEKAALALSNFSKSSFQLSNTVDQVAGGGCLMGCLSRRRSKLAACGVHGGMCTVKTTFCLLEAKALALLVDVLKEEAAEERCVTAAMIALGTLVGSDASMEEGWLAIEQEHGIGPIISLMGSHAPKVQELSAHLCEKLFSVQRYRAQYAGQAQMHIITLAQRGSPSLRHLAGRLLRHLELIHSQSNYFGASSTITTS